MISYIHSYLIWPLVNRIYGWEFVQKLWEVAKLFDVLLAVQQMQSIEIVPRAENANFSKKNPKKTWIECTDAL